MKKKIFFEKKNFEEIFFFKFCYLKKYANKKNRNFSLQKKKDSRFSDEKLFSVGFEPEKGFPTQQCYH